MQYLVVVEKSPRNYSAGSPDVPGCIAAEATLEGVVTLMREALEFHLEDCDSPPEPTSWAIEVKGYVVPITKTSNGYRAEPPDLFPVVAAADTRKRVEALIRETIADYLAWHCKRPPKATAQIVYVDVEVPQPVSA